MVCIFWGGPRVVASTWEAFFDEASEFGYGSGGDASGSPDAVTGGRSGMIWSKKKHDKTRAIQNSRCDT